MIWELARYLWIYRGRLGAGFGLLVAANALGVAIPWILKGAVESLRDGVRPEVVLWAALAIAVAAVFKGTVRIASRHLLLGVSRGVEYDLRAGLFRRLQSLPLTFFQKASTGDIMSRATNDLNAVRMLLGPGVTHGLNSLIVYLFVVSAMSAISLKLTFFAVILFPICVVGMRGTFTRLNEVSRKSQEALSEISTHVHENLSGMTVVKAFVQEENERRKFAGLNEDYFRLNSLHARLRARVFSVMTALGGVGALIIFFVGGRAVIAGDLTLGAFVAFNSYLAMLLWPTIAFGWIIGLFQQGKASWERLEWILNQEPAVQTGTREASRPIRGEIEVRDLRFAYDGGPPILDGLSLRLAPGEKVALVGAIGSGKSTLVRLLTGLLPAPEGKVFLDGMDVNSYSHGALRKAIALVPQDPFLFSRTVRDNVAFGGESPSPDAVRAATDVAHLTAEVEQFAEGFQSMLGERGLTLSTGQRQRTTIARGVVEMHRVLILDDVLSSLDAETSRRVLDDVRRWGREVTVLFVSHNLSAAGRADRILVMDAGRIAEEGRHEELMERGGLYARMHERQRLMAELEAL
ncbi:MAG: ABC transporter ATP-binding protein [Nitrospinota bacterium]